MATPTQIRRRGRWSLILGTLVAALLVAAVAYADNTIPDGDGVAPINANPMAFGDISCGIATNKNALVAVSRNGSATGTNTFANGATVAISVLSVTGTGLSATVPASPGNEITLPGNWTELANNTISASITSQVTINSSVEGPGAGTVAYRASGSNTDGDTINRDATMNVSWNTGSCAPSNTAPTVPGTPTLASGSSAPNQGIFGLTWIASTDDHGPITYQLQHKDADDSGYSDVVGATALSSNSFAFMAGSPEGEGTWTYQVRASDGSLQSAYSGASSAIKVDKSAPNAPTGNANPAAAYNDGTTDWYKDSVTVSFTGNGDPALADGSAGSGVASVTASETFNTAGAFSKIGYVTDNAGNQSDGATVSGNVDKADPVVTLTCPSSPVLLNSTANATWTASDPGTSTTASGILSGEASGQIALDTSSVGTGKTATAPAGTSHDNVGHSSAQTTCSYSVGYNFDGLYAPVDRPNTMNVSKAGQAIPLKWRISDANGPVTNLTSVTVTVSSVSCALGTTTDLIEEVASGSSALQNLGDGYYQYNWKTPTSYANSCKTLNLKLGDEAMRSGLALFNFKK